jgi:hypothetical protein
MAYTKSMLNGMAVVLKDGQVMSVDEIIEALNPPPREWFRRIDSPFELLPDEPLHTPSVCKGKGGKFN